MHLSVIHGLESSSSRLSVHPKLGLSRGKGTNTDIGAGLALFSRRMAERLSKTKSK